ncbi:MAG: DUF2218 domain-containing protein [Marinibacterium sp.]|nr:DUF2218 domain-containing protein [Marinibacterium sp.]
MKLTGFFSTPHAQHYVAQLCKYLAHKIPVRLEASTAYAELPTGPARITAHPSHLRVELTVITADDSDRAKRMIDSHLVRFAHAEDFSAMTWQAVA